MFMDIAMDLLRNVFAKIEIWVSEPSVNFSETGAQTSSLIVKTYTEDKKSFFSILHQPMSEMMNNDY